MNKRGISEIIITLIMVIIVLGIITILWVVLRGFIGEGTEQITVGKECLDVNIKVTKFSCSGTSNDVCSVTFTRSPGGNDIGGIKLVFTNSSATETFVHDYSGNLTALETKTINSISTGITKTNKVDLTVYFIDSEGNEKLCSSPVATYSI